MRKILNSTPVNNECKQQENSGDDSVKEFERMLEEFI